MKNKLVTIILILLLVFVVLVVKNLMGKKDSLVSPFLGKEINNTVPSSTPFYNPPKEIKYDSSTDLKQELESVNPEISEDDFKEL